MNQGSGSGNSLDSQNMVVLYGMAPMETSPRIPGVEPFVPTTVGGGFPPPEFGQLAPCAKCNRHIRYGTECPFCFAQAAVEAAKTPTRAAVDAAVVECKRGLAQADVAFEKATAAFVSMREAYASLGAALKELAEGRLRLDRAIKTLEEEKR